MEKKEEKKKKVDTFLTGVVTASKAQKTVTVNVERIIKHPVYKKIVRKRKKYIAHDEKNKCKPGDIVKIKLVRPISKCKKWLVVNIESTALEKEVTQ